jgi:hypothetical protein
MKEYDHRFSIFFLSSLFVLIVFSSFAYGYGMASSYLANNTLYLTPGESKEYSVELQNKDPTELKFVFQLDSDIASVIDKQEYYLIGNSSVVKEIKIKIDMPKAALPGEEFIVRYSTYPLSSENSQISLNVKLSHDIKVIAITKTKEEKNSNNRGIISVLAIPLLIIIIIIIIFVAFRLFNKSKSLLSGRRFR